MRDLAIGLGGSRWGPSVRRRSDFVEASQRAAHLANVCCHFAPLTEPAPTGVVKNMKRAVACFFIVIAGSTACLASEPVYLTTRFPLDRSTVSNDHVPKLGTSGDYVFIGPYYTDIETRVLVSITKTTTGTNAGPNSNQNSDPTAKTATAAVLYAQIQDFVEDPNHKPKSYKINYSVSCDLTNTIAKGTSVTADNKLDPDFAVSGKVDQVYANSLVVIPDTISDTAKDGEHSTKVGGSFTGLTCPSADSSSFSVTFTLQTIPILESLRFLYWKRNPFFDDTVSFSVDSNGMPSNAQSASTQEITAIITEIAGAVASALKPAGGAALVADNLKIPSARKTCNQDIISFVKNGAYFYDTVLDNDTLTKIVKTPGGVNFLLSLDPNGDPKLAVGTPSDADQISSIEFNLSIGGNAVRYEDPSPRKRVRPVTPPKLAPQAPVAPLRSDKAFPGVMIFFPAAVRATVKCYVPKGERPFALSPGTEVNLAAPTVTNVYAVRAVVDPQRDFLTNPKDTFTFSGGIITGHNYSNQSAAKTVIDTILAPLQAIIPSMNVSQSTTVQNGGTGTPTTTTSTKSSKSK